MERLLQCSKELGDMEEFDMISRHNYVILFNDNEINWIKMQN